jgi:hypothetical protein
MPLVEGADAEHDPSYLAPETSAGRGHDSRSDVFAAGGLLYDLFTCEKPFGRGSAEEIRKRIADGARWIRHDNLDPALARIIARALQFEAAACHQTIEDFLDVLRDFRHRSGQTLQVNERSDDNVRFTVFRPPGMAPQRWNPLLIFAHLGERRPDAPPDEPDPAAQATSRTSTPPTRKPQGFL